MTAIPMANRFIERVPPERGGRTAWPASMRRAPNIVDGFRPNLERP
jgi:hypothetical protein